MPVFWGGVAGEVEDVGFEVMGVCLDAGELALEGCECFWGGGVFVGSDGVL